MGSICNNCTSHVCTRLVEATQKVQEQNKWKQNTTYRGFQIGQHGIDYVSSTVTTAEAVLQNERCKNYVAQLVLISKLRYHCVKFLTKHQVHCTELLPALYKGQSTKGYNMFHCKIQRTFSDISILSFRRVLCVLCFLLGISPASEV